MKKLKKGVYRRDEVFDNYDGVVKTAIDSKVCSVAIFNI